jgi:hypothetical protein
MWKTSAGCGPPFRRLFYQQIEREVKAGSQLAIRRMCALTGVSRAGFYRAAPAPPAEDVKLRDQVQGVALEWPTYGSRRITAELRRAGWRGLVPKLKMAATKAPTFRNYSAERC